MSIACGFSYVKDWDGEPYPSVYLYRRSVEPNRRNCLFRPSGATGNRTLNLRIANAMLSQLSYGPMIICQPCYGAFGSRTRVRDVREAQFIAALSIPALSRGKEGQSLLQVPYSSGTRTESLINENPSGISLNSLLILTAPILLFPGRRPSRHP